MRGEFREEAVEFPFPAYDAHGSRRAGRRFDQAIGDRLGNRIRNTDPELDRTAARRVVPQGLLQFGPEGENVLRVAEGEPARFGQFEVAAAFGEQGRSRVFLQQPDLPADGLRPFLRPFFDTAPLAAFSAGDWLFMLPFFFALPVAMELLKVYFRNRIAVKHVIKEFRNNTAMEIHFEAETALALLLAAAN